MQSEIQYTIADRLEELTRLLDAVRGMLEARGVDAIVRYKTNLALEEMVTNIIKYGFDDDAEHLIDIQLGIDDGRVMVRIRDRGKPYDPLQAPEPRTDRSLRERQPGGLGVHLVRKMACHIAYRRDGQVNELTLVMGGS